MESLSYKSKISETYEKVRKLSFQEKKESGFDEARINKLLDRILEIKKLFADKTTKLNSLVANIEQLTWMNDNDLDNDNLMSINDLISSIRDLHHSLIRQYVSLNSIRSKGIAKEELKSYKAVLDDLKEVAVDLESRFFFLPKIDGFQETTKELSLV